MEHNKLRRFRLIGGIDYELQPFGKAYEFDNEHDAREFYEWLDGSEFGAVSIYPDVNELETGRWIVTQYVRFAAPSDSTYGLNK